MPSPTRRVARDRRRRARRFAIGAALLLVVALYVGPVRSYLGARDRAAAARADAQQLEAQKQQLEQRLHRLSTPAAVIALAREDGYIWPGETAYRIVSGR